MSKINKARSLSTSDTTWNNFKEAAEKSDMTISEFFRHMFREYERLKKEWVNNWIKKT